MLEPATATTPSTKRVPGVVKKRWRAWLRAIHRDVGYLAVGFTIIYAVSGIAMNHIDDWDPNFKQSERSLKIAPITDELTDDEAVSRIDAVTGFSSKPKEVFRAGDEVRLSYENGAQVTAIGADVTVQARSNRFFFRVANWLHATRGKAAWKYIADAYAVLLLYLAISGIFMIKGKLGLKWRGTLLITAGFAVPLGYIVLAGGPDGQKVETKVATDTNQDGIRLLAPEENVEEPASPNAERPIRAMQPVDESARPGDEAAASDDIERPPVRKQPPGDEAAASDGIERPPVRKQPAGDEEFERPPVRKQPPAGS